VLSAEATVDSSLLSEVEQENVNARKDNNTKY
jgi:hypothetical protein